MLSEDANVVAGNVGDGVVISGSSNFAQANFIGTNSSNDQLGNGITIRSSDNIVGVAPDDTRGPVMRPR